MLDACIYTQYVISEYFHSVGWMHVWTQQWINFMCMFLFYIFTNILHYFLTTCTLYVTILI